MIKNSLRTFASLLVLTVPGIALAKAPARTEAPAKTNMSAPIKASTPPPSAAKGAGDAAEHKDGAVAPKKASHKKDAAKTDKSDANTAKH